MSRRALARHVLFFVLAYLVALLLTVPATQLQRALAVAPGETSVLLLGIEGTLWRGSAEAAQTGRLRLKGLRWAFRPVGLLQGRVEFRIMGSQGGGRFAAIIGRSLAGGVWQARQVEVSAPLGEAAELAGFADLGLTGQLRGHFDRIRLDPGQHLFTEGHVHVAEAASGPPLDLSLGSFRVDVETRDDVIIATLTNADAGEERGAIRAEGTARLMQDGTWSATVRLGARAAGGTRARDLLRLLGQPASDGLVELRGQGRLDPWPGARTEAGGQGSPAA